MPTYTIDSERGMISTEWQEGETLEDLMRRIKLAADSIETLPNGAQVFSTKELFDAQLERAAKMIFGESE